MLGKGPVTALVMYAQKKARIAKVCELLASEPKGAFISVVTYRVYLY